MMNNDIKIHELLYELNNDKYKFIMDIILKINNLQFYTCVSQPGTKHVYYNEVKKNILIEDKEHM